MYIYKYIFYLKLKQWKIYQEIGFFLLTKSFIRLVEVNFKLIQ